MPSDNDDVWTLGNCRTARHPHLESLVKTYEVEKRLHAMSYTKPKENGRNRNAAGRRISQSRKCKNSAKKRGSPCKSTKHSDESTVNAPNGENGPYLGPIPCRCGERLSFQKPMGRIIGGTEAKKYEFPWRCSVYGPEFEHLCGATIISHQWLLSAAHCFDEKGHKDIMVRCHLHDHDSVDEEASGTKVKRDVVRVIDHEGYSKRTNENDISLLRVDPPISFGDEIHPICLPWKLAGSSLKGLTVTVSGWGKTEIGNRSSTMKKVTLTTISSEECQEYYENTDEKIVTDRNVCAVGNNVGTCQGDSGGSLDYKDAKTGKYMNIGVVSFAIGCARPDFPTVYTKVTSYLDWILERTEGEAFCQI